MAHIVLDNCIRCKYTDCVDVCPVDCFREGPNMLVIDPDECIDCAVCVPECPAEAIVAEEDVPADQENFIPLNAERRQWPAITAARPAAGADDLNGTPTSCLSSKTTDRTRRQPPAKPPAPAAGPFVSILQQRLLSSRLFRLTIIRLRTALINCSPSGIFRLAPRGVIGLFATWIL